MLEADLLLGMADPTSPAALFFKIPSKSNRAFFKKQQFVQIYSHLCLD